ncbi:MAG: ferric reductase-like transmembrane domain-containing protein [Alphaproteobacteria bacterium]
MDRTSLRQRAVRLGDATSPYLLWLLLALPALPMLNDAIASDDARVFHRLVHPSGETSARLLIVAMIATPLALLLRGWRGPRWLVRNRRYFGVAAFAYAALHTLFYLVDKADLDRVVGELARFYIWTGWLAFLIFLPLAATSMDFAMRKLGRWWKPLQRWTYAAAVLTLLHWAALHEWRNPTAALVHFAPLVLLTGYRLWYRYMRPRRRQAA